MSVGGKLADGRPRAQGDTMPGAIQAEDRLLVRVRIALRSSERVARRVLELNEALTRREDR